MADDSAHEAGRILIGKSDVYQYLTLALGNRWTRRRCDRHRENRNFTGSRGRLFARWNRGFRR